MSGKLRIDFGGESRPGRKSVNQDAFCAHLPQSRSAREYKGAVAIICDGVSSSAESQIASQTVATNFTEEYFNTPPNWSVSKSAVKLLKSLNSWLWQQNLSRSVRQDSLMTTATAAIIKSRSLHIFHVGDTRLYLLRDGVLDCLTNDHARTENGHEYLARALGGDQDLQIDYSVHEIREGDVLLLTTDGVHSTLSLAELLSYTQTTGLTPEAKASNIVDAAFRNGSTDNLSALILNLDELADETLDEAFVRLTERPIPPVMQAGNRIDGYTVLDVIFSGTRSHMYLVQDEECQRFVLKAPSARFTEDLSYLDGFVREEWVGQQLHHPNVMKIESAPAGRRFFYYVGEYIQGQNLREWMHDNPHPPIATVRALAKQMFAGLRAFHRADMIHQDIKPENIMIDRQGQVRILDFGTVLVRGADEIASPLDKSIPQGTVNYTAPEYLKGQSGTPASDLFSLAVVIFEMITGHLPFPERDIRKVRIRHWSEVQCTPASVFRADIPLWVEAALDKALQSNPEFRYQALSELEHDLNVPNRELTHSRNRAPLAARNPLRFWKSIALLLAMANAAQWLYFHWPS